MSNKHSGSIDILKFIGSIFVIMFHFYDNGEDMFHGGKFAVDFFVIISSFFMFSAWRRNAENSPGINYTFVKTYAKKRFLRFFPYTTAAFFIVLAAWAWCNRPLSLADIAAKITGGVWELLLVSMSGLNHNAALLNSPAWTISSMFLTELFILLLLSYNEDLFLRAILPISLLLCSALWRNIESAQVKLFIGFTTFGTLRVYVDSLFAIISYFICQNLRSVNFTKFGTVIMTLFECGGYVFFMAAMYLKDSRNIQFFCILLMTVCVAISFSGCTYSAKFFKDSKITRYLVSVSMCIYLTHNAILRLFQFYFPKKALLYTHSIEYLIISLIGGIVFHAAISTFFKMRLNIKLSSGIRRIMILK